MGKVVEGTVRNLMKFGAFVEIADGIEGLVHVSDLTAEKRINHPSEVLKVDQKIQAVIVEIDPPKRRLKLSIKKLEPDGQDNFIQETNIGDTVTGRVVKVRRREATIELGEGVKGICRWEESTEQTAGEAAESAPSAQDVSSLGDMLRSAWQGGRKASRAPRGPKNSSAAKCGRSRLGPRIRRVERSSWRSPDPRAGGGRARFRQRRREIGRCFVEPAFLTRA